jgi:hypothetical protein
MTVETKQDLAQAVLENLGLGKLKARPGKVLAWRLGERDTRRIRLAINDLIERGHPIIGTAEHGYFIAETDEECREGLERLMSYLKMIAKHHKYLLRASRKLIDPYQIGMKF